MNATLFKRLFFYYFPFKNLLSQLVRALHTVVVFFHLVIEPIDEFHVEIKPIAKIFGAVSRTISLMRLSALLAFKRCRCRYDGIYSGVGVPPNRKYQADNLAKLRQEFLSVTRLIAKIFGAVSGTKA